MKPTAYERCVEEINKIYKQSNSLKLRSARRFDHKIPIHHFVTQMGEDYPTIELFSN